MITTKIAAGVLAVALGAQGVAPWYDRNFPIEVNIARLSDSVVAAGTNLDFVVSYTRNRLCPVIFSTSIVDSQGLQYSIVDATPITGPLGIAGTRLNQHLPDSMSPGRAEYEVTITPTDCDNWTMKVWPLSPTTITLPVYIEPAGTEITPALYIQRASALDGPFVDFRADRAIRSIDGVGPMVPSDSTAAPF